MIIWLLTNHKFSVNSVQLFYNKSLTLSLILVCLRVLLFGQCECCCPGSDRPALCTERVTSSARTVAKPQRCEIAAQQLFIYQECLRGCSDRGPARSVICNGWLTGPQRCCAALPARGPGAAASYSVARWKSRAEGVLQSEMENSLGLCVLDRWFRRAKDQNLP